MTAAYLGSASNYVDIVDAVTGAALGTYTSLGVAADTLAVSPDGNTLAVASYSGVQFVDIATGAQSPVSSVSTVTGVTWAPDSSRVYVQQFGGVATVTPGGAVNTYTAGLSGLTATVAFIAVSPDGHYLYGPTGGSGGVYRWDTTAHTTVTYPVSGATTTASVSVSGDGSTLYVTDSASDPGLVYALNASTGAVVTYQTVNSYPWQACLSPDGTRLWVASSGKGPGGTTGTTPGALQALTTSALATVAIVTAGLVNPRYVAVDPTNTTVWVSNDPTGNFMPVDAHSWTVGTGVPVAGVQVGTIGLVAPAAGGGLPPGGGPIAAGLPLGPLTVTAGGTVSGTPTGPGTVTGTGTLNLGPLTVTTASTYETIGGTTTVTLGPLVVVSLSGAVGPGRHPIPGYRGRWRLTLHNRTFHPATLASTIIAELADARARKLDQTWNTPATLTFTLDGHSQSAGLVEELLHDVVAWRWDDQTGLEHPVFRGPVTQSQDTVDEQSHTVVYTCHDYAAVLTRRLLTATYTAAARDQDLIVADLLGLAETAGSSSGVSFAPASYLPLSLYPAYGNGGLRGLSGQPRDVAYYGSQNVGTALDDLAKAAGGFDWDVRPSAVDTTDLLRVFYPQQGVTRNDGIALQYGSTVATVQRSIDSSVYANYVRVLGNHTGTTPTPQLFSEAWDPTATSITSVPVGLWMLSDDASNVTVQSQLDAKAAGDLNLDAILVPTYTLGLAVDAYTWGNPNMGDVVPLYINSGRLDVDTTVRVLGITYTIGDDGQEDVTLTVGRPQTTLADLFDLADRNVKALAQR